MIKVILNVLFLFGSIHLTAQKSAVSWLSAKDVNAKWEDNKKPIIIDVFTEWCHYCKVMDNTTWKQNDVGNYLNENFYPIKFDAESKEEVEWFGKTYTFKPVYKVNMLAAEWLKGNMIYPSTVILPVEGEPIIIPGVITVKDIEPILHYFGEKHYLSTEWESYKSSYKNTWK